MKKTQKIAVIGAGIGHCLETIWKGGFSEKNALYNGIDRR